MKTKLLRLAVLTFAIAFASVFAFGTLVQAQQTAVDRDLGIFHKSDTNQFGDDRALNSASGGNDRDADYQLNHWTPNTYGISGDYGYYSDK